MARRCEFILLQPPTLMTHDKLACLQCMLHARGYSNGPTRDYYRARDVFFPCDHSPNTFCILHKKLCEVCTKHINILLSFLFTIFPLLLFILSVIIYHLFKIFIINYLFSIYYLFYSVQFSLTINVKF